MVNGKAYSTNRSGAILKKCRRHEKLMQINWQNTEVSQVDKHLLGKNK